ncbi:MAG: TIGR03621 family F420-dependent LLM class oxidoreductase [Chloroflexi bacterium]|nr:TIGR03621 family F420-dependent LLM class oxidoreductase [Chloroflexota bacterium]
MPRLTQPIERWRGALRRIEDLGFSTVCVSEHLTHGWTMEPLTVMTAAVDATTTLRVLSLVLSNDFRHPVLLHKAIATLDVLSGGRVELGIGAGWLEDDYVAAGIRLDPPATRIERLAESVEVIRGLFGPDPVSFQGRHYRIAGLDGLPKPVQQPHPPFMIGGGGPRILAFAAANADIVGVHARLPEGSLSAAAAADLGAERIGAKVRWVREAARAAGRPDDALELQFSAYLVRVSDSPAEAGASTSSFAELLGADPELLAGSPAVLAGSVAACVAALQERRERYGFNYWNLGADIEAVAPIVARLAGT